MNNNKLFKKTLILFAFVLISVSCSKNTLPLKPKVHSAQEQSSAQQKSTSSSSTTEISKSSTVIDTSSPKVETSKPTESQAPPELSQPIESSPTRIISSIGELRVNTYGIIMNFHNDGNIYKSKSDIITVDGFSDSFKKEVKTKTDVKYVIRKITVTSVSSPSTTVEEVQRSIKDNALVIVHSSSGRFNEIQIALAGVKLKSERNARDIASAINTGRSASVTLLVEAFGVGNTAGKFYSSTFEVRFIMQVLM